MSAVCLGEIGQIGFTVKDLERSKTFYRDTLGMKFLFEAGTMAFFQCGTVRLMLGTAEGGKETPVSGVILYFKVEAIEGVCAELVNRGVHFAQGAHLVARMVDHELWMAFLKDPDGNVVGLMSEVR
jgi:methylmalonyl-CoA/ethylmalonyl-CoA epimerase